MAESKELRCRLCGYVWAARVEKPVQCPRCKRYDYAQQEPDHAGAT